MVISMLKVVEDNVYEVYDWYKLSMRILHSNLPVYLPDELLIVVFKIIHAITGSVSLGHIFFFDFASFLLINSPLYSKLNCPSFQQFFSYSYKRPMSSESQA